MITLWVKRIHMYTGLLNFTVLIIFGIIGIAATVLPNAEQRPRPLSTIEVRDFPIPGGMSDRQLADHIYASLNIPLTAPAPDYALGVTTKTAYASDWGLRPASTTSLCWRMKTRFKSRHSRTMSGSIFSTCMK